MSTNKGVDIGASSLLTDSHLSVNHQSVPIHLSGSDDTKIMAILQYSGSLWNILADSCVNVWTHLGHLSDLPSLIVLKYEGQWVEL